MSFICTWQLGTPEGVWTELEHQKCLHLRLYIVVWSEVSGLRIPAIFFLKDIDSPGWHSLICRDSWACLLNLCEIVLQH